MLTIMGLRIVCYLSRTCGSEEQLRENIQRALKLISERPPEGAQVQEPEVIFRRLSTEEAERLGLKGSPTIFINDKEFQPIEGQPQGGFG